jgi:hypothetical protein
MENEYLISHFRSVVSIDLNCVYVHCESQLLAHEVDTFSNHIECHQVADEEGPQTERFETDVHIPL